VNVGLKKENPTQPLYAPVDSENTGIVGKSSHATVYTQPLHAPVASENTTVKQAGLGMIICEYCGIETQKKIYNQRFCCTEHRLAWHGYTPTKK